MIFACEGAEKYRILNDRGETLAGIKRSYDNIRTTWVRGQRYSKKVWLVSWWGHPDVVTTEMFDTLPDIHDKYKFKNYPGFSCLLRRK